MQSFIRLLAECSNISAPLGLNQVIFLVVFLADAAGQASRCVGTLCRAWSLAPSPPHADLGDPPRTSSWSRCHSELPCQAPLCVGAPSPHVGSLPIPACSCRPSPQGLTASGAIRKAELRCSLLKTISLGGVFNRGEGRVTKPATSRLRVDDAAAFSAPTGSLARVCFPAAFFTLGRSPAPGPVTLPARPAPHLRSVFAGYFRECHVNEVTQRTGLSESGALRRGSSAPPHASEPRSSRD